MKKAILVVSFGTSYHETREKTIEQCERRMQEAFPEYDFFRAYTSTMIIHKLKERDGIFIDTPREALTKLCDLGYEEVLVQSLHIICGDEYDKLIKQLEEYRCRFKKFNVGRPLLTTIEDYQKAVEATIKDLPPLEYNEAIVFMGHGTTHPIFGAYCALEDVFRQKRVNAYVATVEGYPTLDRVMRRLSKDGISKVCLIPFMLVAGDHAINDMAGDDDDSWKADLIRHRFKVKTILKGLGENTHIQQLFVEHAKDCLKND